MTGQTMNLEDGDARHGLANFLGTFAFTRRGGLPDLNTLSALEIEHLAQELGWRALARGRRDMLIAAEPDSWFNVILNGVSITLPRYTLMTMRHCIDASPTGVIDMKVETAHWERIEQELQKLNTLFLDIGAATGAMSVPYGMKAAGRDLRIVAFEPSARARGYLEATIARNDAKGITVLPIALSDAVGSFEFAELPEDETGDIPFLPEASRLTAQAGEDLGFGGQITYQVEVSTLDTIADQLDIAGASTVVAKIDVEGFEHNVLTGGLETLKRFMPFLSIDIHVHPGGTETTEQACRDILAPLGYKLEKMGHVLMAQRP